MSLFYLAVGVAFTLFIVAAWLWYQSQSADVPHPLPQGRIIYADHQQEFRSDTLYADQLGLVGRPDYLLQQGELVIPVEIKSSNAPKNPYWSHVVQLAAYCVLVEENYGIRPTHGILQYHDQALQVEFTPALERTVFELVHQMRTELRHDRELPRSHNMPKFCRQCSLRAHCTERLA